MFIFLGKGLAGHKDIGYMSQDYYHCTECNSDFWFSPSVQKCLRETECPECSKKNKKDELLYGIWTDGKNIKSSINSVFSVSKEDSDKIISLSSEILKILDQSAGNKLLKGIRRGYVR